MHTQDDNDNNFSFLRTVAGPLSCIQGTVHEECKYKSIHL